MPIATKAGSFLTGVGGVATTVAVTGIGFVPKAIVFFCSGATALSSTRADIHMCLAFVCTGIKNQHIGWVEDDAAATSSCRSLASSTRTIVRELPVAGNAGEMTLTSLDADGFTMTVNAQFAFSQYVNYLCIGGEDVLNVDVGTFICPTTPTTKVVTGLGFRPDVLFFMSASEATSAGSDMDILLGIATRERAQNGGIAAEAENGQLTTNCQYYQRNGDCFPGFDGSGGLDRHGTVSSFDADGFTASFSETAASAHIMYYLAIKGGSYHLGNSTTPTDTSTTKTVSGFGFLPKAILYFGCELGENANDTAGNDCAITIGARDLQGTSVSMQIESYDNLADSACVISQSSSAILIDTSVTPAVEVAATIPTLGINGFTELNSTNTPATAMFYFFLAIGDTHPNGIYTDEWI